MRGGLLVGLAVLTSAAFGQTAEKVLDRAAKTYSALKSLRVKSTIQFSMKMEGMETTMKQQHEALYARPNLMKARWTGMGFIGDTATVCDGKELFTEMGMLRQTQRAPAPKTLKEFRTKSSFGGGDMGGMGIDEMSLFAGTSWRSLVTKVKLIGRQQLGKRPVYVVQASLPMGGTQTLWIGVRDSFIWQNRIDMGAMLEEMMKKGKGEATMPIQIKGMKMVITETFTQIVPNPPISLKMFTYTLPKDYKFVEKFEFPVMPSEEKATKSEGKPAPDFALPDLQGNTVRLSDHKGKVVVINFFAHWCPPCEKEAPELERDIWQAYKDKGVVLLGVATWAQDDPKKVATSFAQKYKLTYPILVDADDKTAKQYGISAVPTTFVVDRKGTIKKVVVGARVSAVKKAIAEALK